jgi:ribonuclease Z
VDAPDRSRAADRQDEDDDLPGPSVEDLEHAVDNAPVRRLSHGGLTIEGYSRAAVQTYWRVPELKLGFDLGLQPWSFMATPNWFVSHTHLDHIAALPVYVSRRRFMKMSPPTIYLPAGSVDDVQRLLHVIQRLDRGGLPAKLVGLHPGDEVELSRELVVSVFPTRHTIPSLGFLVWERRRKLKPEHHHLTGEQIRDLRLSGVEVAAEVRIPKVAYLGDTTPEVLDANPILYRVEVLILESSFVAPEERPERIHKHGHTHLDDLIARAEKFQNGVIIASHFSTRLPSAVIERIIAKKLPECLKGRFMTWT